MDTDRSRLLQRARDAIREQVCRTCLDSRDDGSCGLTGWECAVERHLSQLVDAVLAVDSRRMQDYERAMRERVCRHCLERDASGFCRLQAVGDCALSTYLPLVVDALDELRGDAGEGGG